MSAIPAPPQPREREPPPADPTQRHNVAGDSGDPCEKENTMEHTEEESMHPIGEQEINIGKGHGGYGDCGFGGTGMLFGLMLGAAFSGGGLWGHRGGHGGGGHLDEALLVRDVLNTKNDLNTRICDVEKEGLKAEARLADKICETRHAVDLNAKDFAIDRLKQTVELNEKFCCINNKLEKVCNEVARIPGFVKNAAAKSTLRNQMSAISLTAAQAAAIGSAIDDIDECIPHGCSC